MKKNTIVIIAAIIAVATILPVKTINKSSSLFDANVEALTEEESTGGEKCYNTITTAEGRQVLYCGDCQWHPGKPKLLSGDGKC